MSVEYEAIIQDGPKKADMITDIDEKAIRNAYEDVRSDTTETQWIVLKYDNKQIVCSSKGSDFEEFKNQFGDDDRAFGYIRLQMGDELSKRIKFLLLTWVGSNVGVIKRAKMSTDKALVKAIISNFAVEVMLENASEFTLENFREQLLKAGGANYGTGIKDF
ncbi:coactosin-like protein [Lycorma delicatula]|uniref:coactosin-like protein n=1 Tax=Lycorma delicatula TaxID=130591 RepID=UPI003F517FAC